MRKYLDGCNLIEFTDKVIADKDHWLGINPLLYHNIYYQYTAEAVKVIISNSSDHEEKRKLNDLLNVCSERFEAIHNKVELNAVKRVSDLRNKALMFTKLLMFDFYEYGNFMKWLEKNQGKKAVVLKCQDVVGQILVKGFNRYGVDIIFSTPSANFDKLTEDQMSLCKKADIIISANVHSTAAPK